MEMKKYRRSPFTIVCYIVAAIFAAYFVTITVSTIITIDQYYAAYNMSATFGEVMGYLFQNGIQPLEAMILTFMVGLIYDEVRKQNPAYWASDDEISEAKEARRLKKEAKQIAKGEAAKVAAEAKDARKAEKEAEAAAEAEPAEVEFSAVVAEDADEADDTVVFAEDADEVEADAEVADETVAFESSVVEATEEAEEAAAEEVVEAEEVVVEAEEEVSRISSRSSDEDAEIAEKLSDIFYAEVEKASEEL